MVEATDADREEHAAVDDQAAAPRSADRPSGWLVVAEAARATGWHPERLRSLARRGMVTSRRGNRGLEVLVEHGLPRPTGDQLRPRGRPTAGPTAADGGGADPAILRDRIEQLREAVDALRDELTDVAKVLAEREAARAVAVADVAAAKLVAEAEIAAKDVLVAELRALLAEARRPWWRRLLAP
ncbi:MAG TPA: hypothetical protein VFY87_25010 [Geminicoccaceae bacterium]|nr:hypothetical protein [Geminicoccaceae bacterium]